MPSRSSRSRKSKQRTPGRVKFLAGVMVVVLVAGVAAVKFFQSPRGRVVLLDGGFTGYYAQVQEEVGAELWGALGKEGLRRHVRETVVVERAGGDAIRPRVWEVPCPEATNLIDLNIAFTKAAARAGARVRRGEERDGGRTLLLHVGSHRYDTHRITLRRLSRVARVRPPSPEPGERALVAIVIDDFGYSTGDVAEAIIDMDLPLTISIIPTLPRSQWALDRARARGRCTILHLPMEADEPGGVDVPPVTVDMSNRDIARMVTRYVDSLPGVDGVNNHQGSGATADRRVMEAVLRELERRDLFFLDSLTSPRSVAYNTAREMGVPTARNSVFLDADTEDSEVVRARLEQLAATARKHGAAVGIAHPHRWTLEALREAGPLFVRAGVEPVYLSEIVE